MQVPCDWLTSLNVKLVAAIYLTQFLNDILFLVFFKLCIVNIGVQRNIFSHGLIVNYWLYLILAITVLFQLHLGMGSFIYYTTYIFSKHRITLC